MKQCRICKCVWTGPDRARPVQDWQSVVQSSPTFHLDWTGLSPTPDWDRPDWWNHCQAPSMHNVITVALQPITIKYHKIPLKWLQEQRQTNREVLNEVLRQLLQPLTFN
jgi:hypothetical protein